VVLVGLCAWAILGRRQSALDDWMIEMRAKGEKLTLEELGLNRPARTNAAMEVIETAASHFKLLERAKISIEHQAPEEIGDERRRVEWAGTNLQSIMGSVIDWDTLGRELSELRPVLESVQEVMRDPPLDSGRDYTGSIGVANLVAIREVAQFLHHITMYDLRRGELSLVHQDLLALIGMAHLHAESWTIVDQMIRSVAASLAADAVWNALQAPGWTDQQLGELQNRLARLSFFKERAQSYRAERAMFGLRMYNEMKTNRNSASSGRLADLPEDAWGFLWKSFWADEDLLMYCRCHQLWIDSMQTLAISGSYRQIAPLLADAQKHLDRKLSGIQKCRYPFSRVALPNILRGQDSLVKYESSRQLAIAAIALKRFEIRHGRQPRDLQELQPEFLSELPVDFYDGKPVRYRIEAGGAFTLYSVGADFQDDGGAPGKDLLWPKPVWLSTDSE
jgi:hypothetical protein